MRLKNPRILFVDDSREILLGSDIEIPFIYYSGMASELTAHKSKTFVAAFENGNIKGPDKTASG